MGLKAAATWSAPALALILAGCGQGDAPGGQASPTPAPADAPDPGYRAAPQVTDLVPGPDGALTLTGRAIASSQVRLASPAGARLETTADGRGVWRAALGPVNEPILYGLSAELAGRRIQAEGYVAVMPGAPTVALLRAGSGALVLDDGKPGLRLLAVDVDSGGATVVSGRALANAPVRIMVDGMAAIEAPAAADGRFSLTLPKALPSGSHHIQALTAKGLANAAIVVGPITPLTEGPYRATMLSDGWRVDWITPGEGLQSTLLLAPPESGH